MKSFKKLALALGLFAAHVNGQGRQGSGVEADGAGEITGVPAPGSTVSNPQIDLNLFRPPCVIDEDCNSGNCENDPGDLQVQDIPGIFYCGNPLGDEDCQQVAAQEGDSEFARVDGICNNLDPERQLWGSREFLQLRRMNGVPLNVDPDESGAPISISPREISDEINDEIADTPNQFGSSTLLAYCGQFIDHDITLIKFQPPDTRISIEGSPPTNTTIVFELSVVVNGSSPVLNPNSATAWMDLSMVYGSDAETAYNLRRPEMMSQLDFSLSEVQGRPGTFMFLPLAEDLALDNRFVSTAMSPAVANLFAAGDIRTNEQVMLASWHTLFMREHNRLVNQVVVPANAGLDCPPQSPQQQAAQIIPGDCERLYQLARRVNIAEWQRIVFGEYFSAWHDDNQNQNGENSLLSGPNGYNALGGYNDSVNPDIDIYFSTAAYRFGHTIVRTYVVDRAGEPDAPFSSVFLGNAFFNPDAILRSNGISGFLNGAANQCGASRDHRISTGIRNFLFGNIPGGEFENSDLIAFNIERGRDHEIALYNDARTFYELPPLDTFEEVVTTNAPPNFETPECVVEELNDVFGIDQLDNMDPFVGMLLEPASFGQMGELMFESLDDQFRRILFGDRFFYENADGPTQAQLSDAGSSLDIIRTTDLQNVLDANTFGNAEIIDPQTGMTRADTQNIFSNTPFLAPLVGEGECCVNDGDTELTPVCFRNTTNLRTFFREDVSRCDAVTAQSSLALSFGNLGGFVAGSMLPITFESYNCNCKLYTDQIQTAFFTIATQNRPDLTSQASVVEQLLEDIAEVTGEDVGDRMPSTNMETFMQSPTTFQIRASCNPTDDTDTYMSCQGMIGAMEAAIQSGQLAGNPNSIMTAEFMEVTCVDCPPLPSDFAGLQEGEAAGAAAQGATLLGFSTTIGAVIIAVIAVVALLIVGLGVRFYMKKNSQQTFTSGQESV